MSRAVAYRVYGLSVDTTLPLSCPRVRLTRRAADVRLRTRRDEYFRRIRRTADISAVPKDWFECRHLATGATYLRWQGLCEFLVSRDGREIEYRRFARSSSESLNTYLLGQVLSFTLLSRGCEPLHATAVEIDGGAVGFLGDCGFGKSTLGAAFVARGYRVLTDDVLALERGAGGWIAHAGPPRLKVFPAIARSVLTRRGGARMNPGTSKLVLPLARTEAIAHTVPLRALYVLDDPVPTRKSRRIGIAPLAAQDAFVAVIGAAFNLVQTDRARLTRQFAVASRLAQEIPIQALHYPRRVALLDRVCDAIVEDIQRLNRTGVRPPYSTGVRPRRRRV